MTERAHSPGVASAAPTARLAARPIAAAMADTYRRLAGQLEALDIVTVETLSATGLGEACTLVEIEQLAASSDPEAEVEVLIHRLHKLADHFDHQEDEGA